MFFPQGYPYGGQSGGVRVVTDAAGRYHLDDCPCAALGGLFVLPPGGGAQWENGGNQCLIMLSTRGGALTTAIDPGARLNWTMLDMPCARDYILPRTIRQEIADIESDPQQLSGGSWQAARERSS